MRRDGLRDVHNLRLSEGKKNLSNCSRWSCWLCFFVSKPKHAIALNICSMRKEFCVEWDVMYWNLQGRRLSHFFCLHGIVLYIFLRVWIWPSWIDTNNESFGMSPNFMLVSFRSFCGIAAWSSDTDPGILYPVGLARPFLDFFHVCFLVLFFF